MSTPNKLPDAQGSTPEQTKAIRHVYAIAKMIQENRDLSAAISAAILHEESYDQIIEDYSADINPTGTHSKSVLHSALSAFARETLDPDLLRPITAGKQKRMLDEYRDRAHDIACQTRGTHNWAPEHNARLLEIAATAGGPPDHNDIARRLNAEFNLLLRPSQCRAHLSRLRSGILAVQGLENPRSHHNWTSSQKQRLQELANNPEYRSPAGGFRPEGPNFRRIAETLTREFGAPFTAGQCSSLLNYLKTQSKREGEAD